MPLIATKDLPRNLGFSPSRSTDVEADDVLVSNFAAEPGNDGPQILLSWDAPAISGSVDEIRLVRKLGAYPLNVDDGVTVLQTSDLGIVFYSDIDLSDNVNTYYYTMFSQKTSDSSYIFDERSVVKSIAFNTAELGDLMFFDLLPAIQRIGDRAEDQEQLKLVPTTDVDTGEQYHFDTDSERDRGPLERFLDMISLELSRAQAFIELIPLQHDPDTVDADFLQELANLVGWELNFDIPIPRQRAEVRGAVALYKKKGTDEGIIILVRNVTGYEAVIEDFADNVLTSNVVGETSLNNNIPRISLQPGDNTYHSLCSPPTGECPYAPLTGGIFITITNGLPAQVVNKLLRVLPDFVPLSTTALIYFQDFYEENLTFPVDDSDWFDSSDTTDEDTMNNTLISNQVGNKSNTVGAGKSLAQIAIDSYFDTSP